MCEVGVFYFKVLQYFKTVCFIVYYCSVFYITVLPCLMTVCFIVRYCPEFYCTLLQCLLLVCFIFCIAFLILVYFIVRYSSV